MSENRGGLHAGYKAGGLAAFAVLAAAGLAPETLAPETLAYQAEPASHTLTVIGTYATGSFDEGASEVVAHDPRTQRIFVINADASRVDVLDMSKPTTLRLDFSIDVADDVGAHGGVNGVDVAGGLVAVAVENGDSALDGFVAFYDTGGAFIGTVTVGNLPDAVKFSPDGDTVVVANEGEPVGDGADPEGLLVDPPGSISIINTADVPTLVATLDFSHFDGREAEFAAKGVKIQPGKSLSEDMEPEHAAFSADGDAVFVTLQEANSFAVVDLTVPRITDIVPLGFKDHSGGQPHLETFPFGDLPLLGTDAAGLDINLGGFSGLAFEGESGAGVLSFMTVPDRGPNGGEVVGGKRTFNLPEYQAAIFFFEVDERAGEAAILDGRTIPLTRDGNMPITGLPNIPGFDEEPVDAAGTAVSYDPFGADLEGIVRDPLDGSFWMVDEYRPAIYHFDADGDLIVRLVPVGTSALAPAHVQAAAHGIPAGMIVPGFYGEERLPEVYNNHRTNRGFEAIAFDEDARRLYAFVQSPMDNPDNSTRDSSVLRILEVDVNPDSSAYLDPVAEYVQLLERPSHAMNTAVDKIGDAILVGPGRFLVIERDGTVDAGGKKYVFEVDIGHGFLDKLGIFVN